MTDTSEDTEELCLQGRTIVSGVAIGIPFFLKYHQVAPSCPQGEEPVFSEEEIVRFRRAVIKNKEELRGLSLRLFEAGFLQEADLVESHIQLASDPVFIKEVEDVIRRTGKNAEHALGEVIDIFRARFKDLPSSYFRQRFEDVEGVCDGFLSILSKELGGLPSVNNPHEVILCARSVTTPVAAQVSIEGIGAIVTSCGGAMSHTAIVAKSKGIPYVTDIDMVALEKGSGGERIIVDGTTGKIILRPKQKTLSNYRSVKSFHGRCFHEESLAICSNATTKDGYPIQVFANIAKSNDMSQVSQYMLDGVGLYRTEYQVLEKRRFPTEEEQERVYSEMAKASAGLPFIIRVFDFGSDKGWNEILGEVLGFSQSKRALSILLDNPHILYTQVRAIMRASRFGMLSILFPMVSTKDELDRCLEVVEAAYKDVSKEISIAFPKIGAMIETPSIIFRTAEVAKRVDFLSLGTNDLIQYALAIDRSNATVFDYRITFHPGLLFLLQLVVEESIRAKIPLCICGEMAADPLLVPFLVGLGISQLSMAPRLSPMVRKVLEAFTLQEMKDVAKKVLGVQSAQEAYVLLRTCYAKVEKF